MYTSCVFSIIIVANQQPHREKERTCAQVKEKHQAIQKTPGERSRVHKTTTEPGVQVVRVAENSLVLEEYDDSHEPLASSSTNTSSNKGYTVSMITPVTARTVALA